MGRQRIIDLLREAVELAGDGGPAAFTEEEYDSMYDFLNELEQENKEDSKPFPKWFEQ